MLANERRGNFSLLATSCGTARWAPTTKDEEPKPRWLGTRNTQGNITGRAATGPVAWTHGTQCQQQTESAPSLVSAEPRRVSEADQKNPNLSHRWPRPSRVGVLSISWTNSSAKPHQSTVHSVFSAQTLVSKPGICTPRPRILN